MSINNLLVPKLQSFIATLYRELMTSKLVYSMKTHKKVILRPFVNYILSYWIDIQICFL